MQFCMLVARWGAGGKDAESSINPSSVHLINYKSVIVFLKA